MYLLYTTLTDWFCITEVESVYCMVCAELLYNTHTHTHTHTHIFKGLRTQSCSKLSKKKISLDPNLSQLYSLILRELRCNQFMHTTTLVWYHQFQNFSDMSHSGLNIMEGEMSNT